MSLLLLGFLLLSSHLDVVNFQLLLPGVLLGFELALLFFLCLQLLFKFLELALSLDLGLALLFADTISRSFLSAFFGLRLLELDLLEAHLIDFFVDRVQLFSDLSRFLLLLLSSAGLGVLNLL